ncbi:hypothetical protein KUTeg_010732 [Tegillarca granosa]|uniref:BTB domain-containing protein n=1 Tax=Tegillarca granosa TaxID=220873 RepID=A0ABQ9F1V7_TEGGR|nr:hypothetical protein KUTeg_010732 [Tegillarca granosa]
MYKIDFSIELVCLNGHVITYFDKIYVVTNCRMAMDQDPEHQGCPFVEEPGITDLALVVEGKKLFVNKFVLAVASPVFKKMFTSKFKEKDTSEVELPGKKYKDVLEFLMCIYPNIMKSVNCKFAFT